MKRFSILIAFFGLFSQHVWAGGCSTVNCGRGCNDACLRMPTSPSNGTFSKVMSKNVAYFNTKDAVVQSFPKALTTRSSAISITESDFLAVIQPNMRQEIQSIPISSTTISMNIGIDDRNNPQTWVLPTNLLSNFTRKRRLDFIATADVPAAAQIAGATHVNKETFVDPDDGHTLVEYAHFEFNAGQPFNELGSTIVDVSDGNAVANLGESAQLYADSPLDLNDVFINHETDYEDDSDLPKTVTTNAVTADGFGTIANPFGSGTLNCLRLSIVQVSNEYTISATTPSSTTTKYFVGWVTKEGFRFYGQKASENPTPDPVTNEVSLSNLTITRFFPMPVLAVELIDFQGQSAKQGVDLTWTTTSEKNNNYFDVERSADGKTFEKIGQVKGSGTKTTKSSYAFRDESPLLGSSITYYRLRQVDFDGTSTTSNVISIQQKSNEKGLKVYPNPSLDNQISIELSENTEGVSVINVLGQVIFQQKTTGQNSLQLDISTWDKGIYFVKTMEETVKFVKN
jgi:Secretion system C-terminal sorting domain